MKINASLFVISMAVVGCSVPPEPSSKRVDTDAAPRPLPSSAGMTPDPVPYVLRADPRLARVQSRVARPKAAPKDTRTPTQLAQDFCSGGGYWHCQGVPHPAVAKKAGAALTVSTLWLDGSNVSTCALDTNSCTSATCGGGGIGPCVTAQEIVSRWGSETPTFDIAVTTNLMSDMQWMTDTFGALVPTLTGDGELDIQGAFGQTYFSAALASFTGLNRSTGAKNEISVTGVDWSTACGGATCVGADVHDTTANLQFSIESDLGSGVATTTTPFELPWRFFATEGTPTAGDAITVGRPVYMSAITLDANGGSAATGNQVVLTELTFANAIGGTQITINDRGYELYANQNATVPPMFIEGSNSGYPTPGGTLVWSSVFGSAAAGAAWSGTGRFFGGLFAGSGSFFDMGSQLDGDVIVDGTSHQNGQVHLGNVYWNAALGPDVDVGITTWEVTSVLYGAPHVWGPGAWVTPVGYEVDFPPGVTATSSVLLTGSLAITGQFNGFGWPWNMDASVYDPPIVVTPANIDALPRGGCLTNPPGGGRWCRE
jgi:hypothetical protein